MNTCKNVGTVDRTIRVILGLIILLASVYYNSYWWILGAIILLTGFFGYCGIYQLFHKTTCKNCDCEKLDPKPENQNSPNSETSNLNQ
jgi:hypothetical protein